MQATDYEVTISSSRWEVQVSYPVRPGSQSCVAYPYLQHLSYLCTWGKPWCAPREWGVVGDGRWHYSQGSKPPVGNLSNQNSYGEGVISCLTSECPNLPCGETTNNNLFSNDSISSSSSTTSSFTPLTSIHIPSFHDYTLPTYKTSKKSIASPITLDTRPSLTFHLTNPRSSMTTPVNTWGNTTASMNPTTYYPITILEQYIPSSLPWDKFKRVTLS